MNNNQEEELTFIFPQNYDTSDKFFGVIDRKGGFIALAWCLGMLFLLSFININLWFRFYFYLIVVVPIAAVLAIGINGDPIPMFIKYILKFYKNAKIYYYSK